MAKDYRAIRAAIKGRKKGLSEAEIKAADVNNDGKVDEKDLAIVEEAAKTKKRIRRKKKKED
jgi:hypothetical protein